MAAETAVRMSSSLRRASATEDGDGSDLHIERLVAQARVHLEEFAAAKGMMGRTNALAKFGRHEGLFTAIRLAQLDSDGSGKLGPKELAKFKVLGQEVVDSYKNWCEKDAVVVTLVLSLLWSSADPAEALAFDAPEDAVLWDARLGLTCASYVLVNLAISCMLAVLVYIASIYHVLTFWLPSLMTKLWFCDKLQNQITHLVKLKNFALLFGALSLGTKGLITCGWLGVAGFLPFFGVCIPLYHMFGHLTAFVIQPYLHQEAKTFMMGGGPQELSAFRTATAVASAKDDPAEQEMPSVDVPRDSRKSVSGEL